MPDLKAKPFCLNDEAEGWVKETLSNMTDDEKLGQVFIDLSYGGESEDEVRARLERTKCGGLRYMNHGPREVWEQNGFYQKNSKLPLLIAANVEAGGNGACKGGTTVGAEIKVASTGETEFAYLLGKIGGLEAKALGCNWAFTPICDLSLNWRNPIISTRTWGRDTDMAINFSRACLRGLHDAGVAATAKHFPGDGVDERDHHFSSSVNTMTVDEWDNSFGRIYSSLIEDGVDAVMAGHIMLPEYQKKLNPQMKPNEIMPASMCRELLTGLLREKLGFNGVILTDATHMVGMSSRMPRKDGLAAALNAGCDMILFFNDVEEDMQYMRENIAQGKVSPERLDEAVTRVLALKASLGLHKSREFPTEDGLSIIGCDEHRAVARTISDKGITLAKQTGDNVFPITKEKYRRIMIMPVNTPPSEFAKMVGDQNSAKAIAHKMRDKLCAMGFEAEVFVSPLDPESPIANRKNVYAYKSSIEEFKSRYDLVLTLANCGSFGIVQRLSWDAPKGGFEVPWYVNDLPVVFVSFGCPFHLADVPQVKNYINCYDAEESTIDSLVEKLTGASLFVGSSPVDVFCGLPDTRL